MAIETLGEAFSLGMRILMRCGAGKQIGLRRIPECQFQLDLDLQTLICTRGEKQAAGRRLKVGSTPTWS